MHGCSDISAADGFARRVNFITAIDPRVKLGFTAAALAVNLLSPGLLTPLAIAIFSLGALAAVRVPLRLLALRLAAPLAMAAVILITQTFLNGTTAVFVFRAGELSLTGYREGLAHGVLVASRVLGGVALVLSLSLSTSADRLFMAAAWFKVPGLFIELALLIYRYVFVLVEELAAMKDAHRVRLGFLGWQQALRSLGTLGACLILRAYDRAPRIFDAMLLRGYSAGAVSSAEPFRRADGVAATVLVALLAAFYMAGTLA